LAIEERRFEKQAQLALALAEAVAEDLRTGLTRQAAASLAVCARPDLFAFFAALRTQPLDWSRVEIALTDECWVPPSSEQSCERVLRRHLIRDEVLDARLIGLWTNDPRPIQAAPEIAERLTRMTRPYDAVVLDVGEDGRVAGLFPGMPGLSAMLNPNWAVPAAPARDPDEDVDRVTMTLRALLDSRRIYLVPAGEGPRAAYARAIEAKNASPVRALLAQNRTPVTVMLCDA
jgi:6-phosphogluconolactonase